MYVRSLSSDFTVLKKFIEVDIEVLKVKKLAYSAECAWKYVNSALMTKHFYMLEKQMCKMHLFS